MTRSVNLIMKYFTKILRNAFSDESERKWFQNSELYLAERETLRPMLSKKAQAFFYKICLHDALVLSCAIGNTLAPSRDPKNYIEMKVRTFDRKYVYTLRFSKIFRYKVDYTSKNEYLDCNEDPPVEKSCDYFCFGYWLYEELTLSEQGNLQLEIVISQDNSLLIEFGHFTYKRQST